MKVTLVVSSGAHQGKVIPITGSQFLIGRDAQCHLRPASQAISKRHCGVLVRDGKVYIKDFGSTNGTTVNDVLIKDAEVPIVDGATLKLGPLDFTVRVEQAVLRPDGTPLPGGTPEAEAALAAVKAATKSAAGSGPKTPLRDATPNPARPAKPATKDAPAIKPPAEETSAAPSLNTSETITDDDHDRMAALLLSMDDGPGVVPDGSTVIDTPAVDAQGQPVPPGGAKPDDKKGKKGMPTREDTSNAANDLLRKMRNRPR
jgi:predicted component of type VI protein secretion system